LTVLGVFQGLVTGEEEEEVLGSSNVLVTDAGQDDVGPNHGWLGRVLDDRVQRANVRKPVLGGLAQGDIAVA
jgi:hypothetical protein